MSAPSETKSVSADGGLCNTEQDTLQSLLANILNKGNDDGSEAAAGAAHLRPGTPGISTASAPTSPPCDEQNFVTALLGQPGGGLSCGEGKQESDGIDAWLKSWQPQQAQVKQQQPSELAALLNARADSPRAPQPSAMPQLNPKAPAFRSQASASASAMSSLVSSFLTGNQGSAEQATQRQPGQQLLSSLLQGQGISKDATNNLLKQLLVAKLQNQQHQHQQSSDLLSQLLASNQPQQQQPSSLLVQQSSPSSLGLSMSGDALPGLLGIGSGARQNSLGLEDLVNQVIGTRNIADSSPARANSILNMQHTQQSDDVSNHAPQQSSVNSANLHSPLKRKLHDGSAGSGSKFMRLQDDEHESREKHLSKLRDQLKNLNAANGMLSRYLNSMQDSLSEILAENWSFKILIGCLTSKNNATNPLEQMISARIASNPQVAIPMLKNIHKTATANKPEDPLDENANKNAVFQNMVGLLAAQKASAVAGK